MEKIVQIHDKTAFRVRSASLEPNITRDIESLEKVQRRTKIKNTKLTTQLSNLSYGQRLAELGLTSLKDRRVRGNLIQMFKIMELEVVE